MTHDEDEARRRPKLTDAQNELISKALCEAARTNNPSQLSAIRSVLVNECREVNAETVGSHSRQ